eukprot:CAMPEP_0171936072 /NCGR_PEP_ID=MMETSP0993-20121228/33524_1 /TAXON_ID=483369 /ORGANISM="non described non described, Strain CCMP2098" /LENGTH=72 /DNA_ID=CAMNT_0012577153 /DNA_START=46 /DNA_END=261 /DNA_ORIENTATION=+
MATPSQLAKRENSQERGFSELETKWPSLGRPSQHTTVQGRSSFAFTSSALSPAAFPSSPSTATSTAAAAAAA